MRALLVLAVVLLAGCASRPARVADESTQLTIDLETDSFYVAPFEVAQPSRAVIEVEALEGGPIDAWLAVGTACDDWLRSSFQPIRTAFSTTNATMEADLPKGRACLPIDNTDVAPGTANSGAPAKVRYSIELFRR